MTVTDPQVRSAAALVAVVPDLVCRLTTAAGARIVAGAGDSAQVCGQAFRDLVVSGQATDAAHLQMDGIDPRTGLAVTPGARWFVSPLPASHTTAALRDAQAVAPPYLAMVRGDQELGVSVVRVTRSGFAAPAPPASSLPSGVLQDADSDLDEIALAAFSSCLVAHLIATTDAV